MVRTLHYGRSTQYADLTPLQSTALLPVTNGSHHCKKPRHRGVERLAAMHSVEHGLRGVGRVKRTVDQSLGPQLSHGRRNDGDPDAGLHQRKYRRQQAFHHVSRLYVVSKEQLFQKGMKVLRSRACEAYEIRALQQRNRDLAAL